MTKEAPLEKIVINNSWMLGVIRDRCELTQAEKDYLDYAIEYLKQEPCEDATLKDIFCMGCEYKEQEPCREADDYENEIADLHNRLDIAEYDKERLREEVTALEEKLKALSEEPCEDAISRQVVLDLIERMKPYQQDADGIMEMIQNFPSVTPKVAECEDAISRAEAEALFRNARSKLNPSDYKTADEFNTRDLMLLNAEQFIHLLPSVTPKQKMGRWVKTETIPYKMAWTYKCSECSRLIQSSKDGSLLLTKYPYCHCGAKMEVSE